jgi:hypothetical protein
MTKDEVLALVAGDARADIRLLVDEKGKRLPLEQLPDALANSLEGVEFDEFGHVHKVKLASKVASRRTILEVTGAVSGESGVDQLAALLRETLEQNRAKTRT